MQRWLFESIRYSQKNDIAKKLIDDNFEDVEGLLNDSGSSLLHVAADHSNVDIVDYILSCYQKRIDLEEGRWNVQGRTAWVNRRDGLGFTPIHYAAFRHHLGLVQLLQRAGSDIYQQNKDGLSCLHLSAQGGSPFMMYYFMGKGMKISSLDDKGNTALHWATYTAMEHAVAALIAWGAEIDRQEHQHGMTPLHLAVLSGNSRVVRRLLQSGCDRSLTNLKGQTALNIAVEKGYSSIAKMIEDRVGLKELLNISPRFSQTDRRHFPYYFFVFLFASTYFINVVFLFPFETDLPSMLTLTGLVIGLTLILLYFKLSFSDPGQLQAKQGANYFKMLKQHHPSQICYDCSIVKPPRSRHCTICKKCIKVFDHHCPWIGNCVGSNNYLTFFLFLSTLILYIIFVIIYHITNLFYLTNHETDFILIFRIIACGYNLFISCVFLLPVAYLFAVQINNCIHNRTTFEKYLKGNKTKAMAMKPMPKMMNETLLLDKKTMRSTSLYSNLGHEKEKEKIIQAPTSSENCLAMCIINNRNASYDVPLL